MMISDDFFTLFFTGLAGAAALELLKLYDYRGKLTQKKYKALLKSFTFWAVIAGMLLASGFVAWAFHTGSENVRVWNVVLTGMAARSIVREVASGQVANASTKLGSEDEPSLKDVFV